MAVPSTRTALAVAVALLSILCATMARAEIEVQIDVEVKQDETTGDNKTNAKESEQLKADTIRFQNHDFLHGRMVSMSPAKGVRWITPEADSPILFRMDNIASVDFGHILTQGGDANTAIFLTNYDILKGKLVELNADKLVLETGYAGTLDIDRQMVSEIVPSGGGRSVYHGPMSLKEWAVINNRGGNSITVDNGVLSVGNRSAVARDMNLQKRSVLEFSYKSTGSGRLRVMLHQKGAKSREGYYIVISPGYVYLQRRFNNSSTSYGSTSIRALQAGKGKIAIFTDLEAGRVALYVNGNKAKQWNDENSTEGGTFFGFASEGNSTYEISQITVKAWDGKLPAKGGKSKKAELSEKDSIMLVNKDQISGKLRTIENGVVVFSTDYAELKIPMQRVARIKTAGKKIRRARRNTGDAQLFLEDDCVMTLAVASINDGVVKGESENFGEITVKINAIRSIHFNIYSEDDE